MTALYSIRFLSGVRSFQAAMVVGRFSPSVARPDRGGWRPAGATSRLSGFNPAARRYEPHLHRRSLPFRSPTPLNSASSSLLYAHGRIELPISVNSGRHGFAVRILPHHPGVVHPYDGTCVPWG